MFSFGEVFKIDTIENPVLSYDFVEVVTTVDAMEATRFLKMGWKLITVNQLTEYDGYSNSKFVLGWSKSSGEIKKPTPR